MIMFENIYHSKDLSRYTFLVTGGAGFIGANLVEYLLINNVKKVVVLDNFATGKQENIESLLKNDSCVLIEGDIRDLDICKKAMDGVDYVLHQAALGSVPRSINDPITSNSVNVSGFLNMLMAAKESKTVKRMVYAASSSTYGDHLDLPKVEHKIGNPLSPYAVTKYVNELYAEVFYNTYGLETIGLRYFNVFGPKQDPKGAYAAVIPLFFDAALKNKEATINGDGSQTRDFTFVENVIQANIRAIFSDLEQHEVFNVACGERISINKLWDEVKAITNSKAVVNHGPSRQGDVKNSLADISKINKMLGYTPNFKLKKGLEITYNWFEKNNNFKS